MDISNWEHRKSDIETNRELESQRLELYQANQWADQAQREKINLYGELEMRNRLCQESRAQNCQEIEELRRICCEETDRARQLMRIDELSMQHEKNLTTGSQLFTHIHDFPNKVNSLADAWEFLAREGPSSALFENSLNLASSFCALGPCDTGNIMEYGRGVRREQSSSIPNPQFLTKVLEPWTLCVILEALILAMVWWITRDFRSRKCI